MKGSPIFGAENPMPFIEWPSLTQDERSPDQGSLKYQPGSLRGRVGAIGLALAYLLFGRIVRVGRSIATLVLVIMIVVTGVRFAIPKIFCSLSWPGFVSSICSP